MSEFTQNDSRINRKGRPKGAKSHRTEQWEYLGKFLIDKGAKRFIKVLHSLDDEQYVEAYTKIIKHFKPQLKQIDATLGGRDGKPITIGFSDTPDIPDDEDEQA